MHKMTLYSTAEVSGLPPHPYPLPIYPTDIAHLKNETAKEQNTGKRGRNTNERYVRTKQEREIQNTKLAGDQKTINKKIPSLMFFFFFLFLLLSFRKSLDRFAQIKWI